MKMNRAGQPLANSEPNRDIHETIEIQMDAPIRKEDLENAVEQTLCAFPNFRDSITEHDKTTYFEENDRPIQVFCQQDLIAPCSEALNRHTFCIVYYGDILKFCYSHIVTDGMGSLDFIKTVLYYYCVNHYKEKLDASEIRTHDGEKHPDDDTDFCSLNYDDCHEVKIAAFEKDAYQFPIDEKKRYEYIKVTVPSASFIEFVKKYHGTPAIMTPMLLAKAIYHEEPTIQKPIVARVAMNARNALGIPHSQRNCSLPAHVSFTKKQIMDEDMADVLLQARQVLKNQMEPQYVKYLAQCALKTGKFPDSVTTFSSAYMGTLRCGGAEKHIKQIALYSGTTRKIYSFEFNGEFNFILMFGTKTQKYALYFENELSKHGVTVHTSDSCTLKPEIKN